MPYYPFGNGTIVTPEWLNDIQSRIYNPDTGEYRQWLDSDLSDNTGQIKNRLSNLTDEFKFIQMVGLYAQYKGGKIRNILGETITIPDGTILLTDNSTNYIGISKSGEIIVSSTINGMCIAKVILSNGVLVSSEDLRSRWLVFDVNDIQNKIFDKTSSFTVQNNYSYIVNPNSTDIVVGFPTETNIGDIVYLIIKTGTKKVNIAGNININGDSSGVLLSQNSVYKLTKISSDEWCASIMPIGLALNSKQLSDMPNILQPQKLLKTNISGTGYELVEQTNSKWTVISDNYTAATGEKILGVLSAGKTLNLPANAISGDSVEVFGDFSTNNLAVNRNGLTIDGQVANGSISTNKNLTRFIYSGTTWISNLSSVVSETTQSNDGTLGQSNSIYTSTLIAKSLMGSGCIINESTQLCLLAYGNSDNQFIMQPAVLAGSDVFTFYKSTVFFDVTRDVFTARVSNTTGIVVYYIPGSDTVVVRLVQVSTLGIVLLSQSNISGATYTLSPIVNISQAKQPAFVAHLADNKLCVATRSGLTLFTITNNNTLNTVMTAVMPSYTAYITSIIDNGRYWYISGINWITPPSYWHGQLTVIDTTNNQVAYNNFDDNIGILFKEPTNNNVAMQIGLSRDMGPGNPWYNLALIKTSTLTTTTPFYTLGNSQPSSMWPTISNSDDASTGFWLSKISNKFIILLSNGTKTSIGNQNSSGGVISTSAVTNFLGLPSPTPIYTYFGYISASKACVVANGFVAIVYI